MNLDSCGQHTTVSFFQHEISHTLLVSILLEIKNLLLSKVLLLKVCVIWSTVNKTDIQVSYLLVPVCFLLNPLKQRVFKREFSIFSFLLFFFVVVDYQERIFYDFEPHVCRAAQWQVKVQHFDSLPVLFS